MSDADWSTDGELLAVGGVDRDHVATVSVADQTGQLLTTLRFPGQLVETARSTADDDRLVIALSQRGPYVPGTGRVEVWDWRGEDVLRTFDVDSWSAMPHPSEPVVAIVPRADALGGRRGASGSAVVRISSRVHDAARERIGRCH